MTVTSRTVDAPVGARAKYVHEGDLRAPRPGRLAARGRRERETTSPAPPSWGVIRVGECRPPARAGLTGDDATPRMLDADLCKVDVGPPRGRSWSTGLPPGPPPWLRLRLRRPLPSRPRDQRVVDPDGGDRLPAQAPAAARRRPHRADRRRRAPGGAGPARSSRHGPAVARKSTTSTRPPGPGSARPARPAYGGPGRPPRAPEQVPADNSQRALLLRVHAFIEGGLADPGSRRRPSPGPTTSRCRGTSCSTRNRPAWPA